MAHRSPEHWLTHQRNSGSDRAQYPIEGRETGAGLTALFNADREGFDALQATNTDPVRDADTGERVRQLDRTFGIGMAKAESV